jgi:hypothetical protein
VGSLAVLESEKRSENGGAKTGLTELVQRKPNGGAQVSLFVHVNKRLKGVSRNQKLLLTMIHSYNIIPSLLA